jgi:hypothetical protein
LEYAEAYVKPAIFGRELCSKAGGFDAADTRFFTHDISGYMEPAALFHEDRAFLCRTKA